MDNLKCLRNEISDLLMLNSDNEFPNEDHEYFDRICNNYLDCCADVKTKINDLTQERFEMLTQRSHKSSTKSSISKLPKVSSMSSRQAAADKAARIGEKEKRITTSSKGVGTTRRARKATR